jgi:hypothetical protein
MFWRPTPTGEFRKKRPNEPPDHFNGSGNGHELAVWFGHTHEETHNQATLTDRAA